MRIPSVIRGVPTKDSDMSGLKWQVLEFLSYCENLSEAGHPAFPSGFREAACTEDF